MADAGGRTDKSGAIIVAGSNRSDKTGRALAKGKTVAQQRADDKRVRDGVVTVAKGLPTSHPLNVFIASLSDEDVSYLAVLAPIAQRKRTAEAAKRAADAGKTDETPAESDAADMSKADLIALAARLGLTVS